MGRSVCCFVVMKSVNKLGGSDTSDSESCFTKTTTTTSTTTSCYGCSLRYFGLKLVPWKDCDLLSSSHTSLDLGCLNKER